MRADHDQVRASLTGFDADIAWRDVRIGALITTLLFMLGKLLLGVYSAASIPEMLTGRQAHWRSSSSGCTTLL
ncbi:hypothetical protein BH23GEM5_BH23GEM5_06050 [soil metagenome]